MDIAELRDGFATAAMRAARGHTCAALLDPPLPDLRSLPVPTRRSGTLLLQADDVTHRRGRYELMTSSPA